MKKYKAVVFDLDGTLLDTLEDLADSMNTVLKNAGFPAHPVSSYKYFVGEGMDVLVRKSLPPDAGDPETRLICLRSLREEYKKNWKKKTKPYQGIPELLTRLAARKIPMAILSNKPRHFTELTVKELLGNWRFEIILGAREGIPNKPAPDSALEIAEKLGLKPEECLFLGDTSIDMKTAAASGMYPVGALWGFRDEKELIESGAVQIVKKPEDIVNFV